MPAEYLSAGDAAAFLGVSRNSLYAYASRGSVRVKPDARDPRRSRYLAADVERLRRQADARRHPDAAVRDTLHLGLPILESALTLIDAGHLYYRGQDAIRLARRVPFEDVV